TPSSPPPPASRPPQARRSPSANRSRRTRFGDGAVVDRAERQEGHGEEHGARDEERGTQAQRASEHAPEGGADRHHPPAQKAIDAVDPAEELVGDDRLA